MTMWMTIFAIGLALLITCIFVLIKKIRKFDRRMSFWWGLLIVAILFGIFFLIWGLINAVIIILHLVGIWIICDIAGSIIRKAGRKRQKAEPTLYIEGIIALAITFVYMSIGWYLANNVWLKEYELSTDKNTGVENFRVVGFGDAHMGTLFGAEKLSEHIDTINAQNPDIVVIVGDFIDDATTKEVMEQSCAALAKIESTYGVFYAYGNHDAGYNSASKRGYSPDDFERCLKEAGVHVMKDDIENIVGNIYLVGRNDTQVHTRKSARELAEMIPEGGYSIVLDHEPNDYANEEAAKFDLVLSGHTHGGQIIPVTRVGELIGANDKTYGYERRNQTDFIVTSGIAAWEIRFKTGCKSEIFVVDVSAKSGETA